MAERFCWTAFDVTDLLPQYWLDDIKGVARDAEFREYPPTPFLSREAKDVTRIYRGRVRADKVQLRLPWLYKLYRGEFLDLAGQAQIGGAQAFGHQFCVTQKCASIAISF